MRIRLGIFGALLTCAACGSKPAPPTGTDRGSTETIPTPPVVAYQYQTLNSKGAPMATGTLWLPAQLDQYPIAAGQWKSRAVGTSEHASDDSDIRFQNGIGDLQLTVKGSSIHIEFYPTRADHNFYLEGAIEPNGFTGTWGFATDEGDFPKRGRCEVRRK